LLPFASACTGAERGRWDRATSIDGTTPRAIKRSAVRFSIEQGFLMQDRPAELSHRRRRLLGGLAASGIAIVLAGCDRPLPLNPNALTSTPARKPQPVPLEPVAPPAAPDVTLDAVFGRVVRLEGVTIERETVRPGEYLRIWLHWQSVAPSQEDLRTAGQLIADGWKVLASEDDQIGRRKRFLSRWDIGERSVNEMRIRVGPSVGPGEYGLAVGVLRPDNQTHVPLTSRLPASSVWKEDAVLVGTIDVVSA
jgi:hypothetical protein